jgi:hypothetical protein
MLFLLLHGLYEGGLRETKTHFNRKKKPQIDNRMRSVGFEPTTSSVTFKTMHETKTINHDPRGRYLPCCIVDYICMSVKINFEVGPHNCNWYIGC